MVKTIPVVAGGTWAVEKILAVGRNYAAHAAEMQAPAEPVIFSKPRTAIRLPGETVVLPRERGSIHFELELVVALQRGGSRLSEAEARDCICGYGLGLDLTLRDVQAEAKAKGRPWTLAKGFDGSLPLSPFVPVDAVPNPDALVFRLEQDGTVKQTGRCKDMLLPVPALLAYISTWISLEPGDLVLTGTPEGVGPVHPGDTLSMILEDHLETHVHFE